MKVTVYKTEAWTSTPYLALMDLGMNCTMNFHGKTADEAKSKAEDFYKAEAERQRKLVGSSLEQNEATANKPAAPVLSTAGRGAHFAGRIWMLNHVTRQKVRIEPTELAAYEAAGFVRGGPRSKLVED